MNQPAKLRFELHNGNFMLAKLTDMNTGVVIPISSVRFFAGVDDASHGHIAELTITVPIDEMIVDGVDVFMNIGHEHVKRIQIQGAVEIDNS